MATYRQDFHIRGSERVDMALIVSDTYDGLTAAATSVSGILGLGTSQKDLDVDVGVQGADKLELSLDPLAALNATDNTCVDFILDAQKSAEDETKKRYIGLVLNEATPGTPVADDFEFRGVIEPQFSGDGSDWKDGQYGDSPNPDWAWKLSAISLEVADILSTKLEDLVEEITTNHTAWMDSEIKDRLGWFKRVAGVDSHGHREGRYADLVNLLNLLNKCFEIASDGHPLGVSMVNTDLGIRAVSGDFVTYSDTRPVWDPESREFSQELVDFRYGDPTHFWPAFGGETYGGMNADDRGDWPYHLGTTGPLYVGGIRVSWRLLTPRDEARPVSWLPYDTLGGLLYAVAYTLGGWVEWTYTTATTLECRILTRKEMANAETLVLSDAVSDEIDVEPSDLVSHTAQAPATLYCGEGWPNSGYNYDDNGIFVKNHEWTFNEDDPNLPLTISPTVCNLYSDSWDAGVVVHKAYHNAPMPHNGVFYNATGREREGSPGADLSDVHTAMYMSFLAPANDPCIGCANTAVTRPIAAIAGKRTINGVETSFVTHTIQGYLEILGRTDRNAYKFERRIKVPYLTKFRESAGGTDDWRHCKPGRVITLDGQDWLIAGLTRDFREGSTTLRLHTTARIAFSEGTGTLTLDPPQPPSSSISSMTQRNDRPYERDTYGAGSAVVRFAAVFAGPDQQVHVATADGWAYGRIIGVATRSGPAGTPIDIQTDGILELDQDYGFRSGQIVYLRTIGSGSELVANLSTEPLRHATSAENLHYPIGVVRSPRAIEIQIGRPFYVKEDVPEIDFESIGEVFT